MKNFGDKLARARGRQTWHLWGSCSVTAFRIMWKEMCGILQGRINSRKETTAVFTNSHSVSVTMPLLYVYYPTFSVHTNYTYV